MALSVPRASTATRGHASGVAAGREGQQGEGRSPAALCSPSPHGARGKGRQHLGPTQGHPVLARAVAAEGSLCLSPSPCPAPAAPTRPGRLCWASRAPRSRPTPPRRLCASLTLSPGCANQEPPSPVQSTPWGGRGRETKSFI